LLGEGFKVLALGLAELPHLGIQGFGQACQAGGLGFPGLVGLGGRFLAAAGQLLGKAFQLLGLQLPQLGDLLAQGLGQAAEGLALLLTIPPGLLSSLLANSRQFFPQGSLLAGQRSIQGGKLGLQLSHHLGGNIRPRLATAQGMQLEAQGQQGQNGQNR